MTLFSPVGRPEHVQLPSSFAGKIAGSVGEELVYAVGDIHGRYDLLKLMLSRISEDIARVASPKLPILIFCGDYVDRGPDSAKVLTALAWLRSYGGFELHLLKGNHEQSMLTYLDDPLRARDWVTFGGADTMRSFDVTAPSYDDGDEQHWRARNELLDKMSGSQLLLLQRLEPAAQIGDFAFVHAGIRPQVKLARQNEHDLLWIRDDFVNDDGPYEKIIVHGHSFISSEPVVTSCRIGLDTGAYETGVLTALRLHKDGHGFLRVSS